MKSEGIGVRLQALLGVFCWRGAFKFRGPRRLLHGGPQRAGGTSAESSLYSPSESAASLSRSVHDLTRSSRGDKTAIELFVAGIRGWEAGIRRFMVELPDGKRPSR